jgi:fucose permease
MIIGKTGPKNSPVSAKSPMDSGRDGTATAPSKATEARAAVPAVNARWSSRSAGRRGVLSVAAGLLAAGLLALGAAPTWLIFLLAGLPAALGGGALDGGASGLFLDLYPARRGAALNRLHPFFGVGALLCPLSVGLSANVDIPWQAVLIATSVVVWSVAGLLAMSDLPAGRRMARGVGPNVGAAVVNHVERWLVALLAITTYVAAEVGRLELACPLPRKRAVGCRLRVSPCSGAAWPWVA